jgi:hypothetical protein
LHKTITTNVSGSGRIKNLISRENVFDSFGGGYRLIVSSRRSEFNFPRRFDCLLNPTVFYRNLTFFLYLARNFADAAAGFKKPLLNERRLRIFPYFSFVPAFV